MLLLGTLRHKIVVSISREVKEYLRRRILGRFFIATILKDPYTRRHVGAVNLENNIFTLGDILVISLKVSFIETSDPFIMIFKLYDRFDEKKIKLGQFQYECQMNIKASKFRVIDNQTLNMNNFKIMKKQDKKLTSVTSVMMMIKYRIIENRQQVIYRSQDDSLMKAILIGLCNSEDDVLLRMFSRNPDLKDRRSLAKLKDNIKNTFSVPQNNKLLNDGFVIGYLSDEEAHDLNQELLYHLNIHDRSCVICFLFVNRCGNLRLGIGLKNCHTRRFCIRCDKTDCSFYVREVPTIPNYKCKDVYIFQAYRKYNLIEFEAKRREIYGQEVPFDIPNAEDFFFFHSPSRQIIDPMKRITCYDRWMYFNSLGISNWLNRLEIDDGLYKYQNCIQTGRQQRFQFGLINVFLHVDKNHVVSLQIQGRVIDPKKRLVKTPDGISLFVGSTSLFENRLLDLYNYFKYDDFVIKALDILNVDIYFEPWGHLERAFLTHKTPSIYYGKITIDLVTFVFIDDHIFVSDSVLIWKDKNNMPEKFWKPNRCTRVSFASFESFELTRQVNNYDSAEVTIRFADKILFFTLTSIPFEEVNIPDEMQISSELWAVLQIFNLRH